jgi:outer membrane immunogenic protein
VTLSVRAVLVGIATSGVALGALAADRPSRAPPPQLVPTHPVFTWAGFCAGWAVQTESNGFTDPSYGTATGGGRSDGFAGGDQIGYCSQLTPGTVIVVGFEAAIQGIAFATADAAYLGSPPFYSVRPSLDCFGTVRGQLGSAFDRVLICGTGGFSHGGGARSSHAAAYRCALPGPDRTGSAAGVAFEHAFPEKLSAKVEALYAHLDRGFAGTTDFNARVPE